MLFAELEVITAMEHQAYMYVKVAYTEVGADVMLPLHEGLLDVSTLQSQFPGAVGLKYNDSGQWKALNLTPGGFRAPEGGWGSRKYIAVTESIGTVASFIILTFQR